MTAKKGNLSWLSAFVAFDMAILLAVLAPQLRLIVTEPEVVARAASSLLAPPSPASFGFAHPESCEGLSRLLERQIRVAWTQGVQPPRP